MKKWFKMLGMSLAVVLVLSTIAGVALAQGPVDENDDGLCDECGEEMSEGLMRGRDSQDARGSQGARGEQNWSEMPCDDFVDEDGDGVCDECGAVYEGEQRGPRYGQNVDAQGAGRGNAYGEGDRESFGGDDVCDDFVDEDGDGLCDNEGEPAERSFGGRDGNGGRGNWNQDQGQGSKGRNRS